MSRLALPFLLWASVLCAPLRAAAQDDETEIEHPEIVELVFTGVRSVNEDELRESISTEQSECKSALFKIFLFCTLTTSPMFVDKHYLDRSELSRDLLRIRIFYWRHGFREAQVDTTVREVSDEGDKVRVTLSVTEGPPTLVSSIRVLRPPDILSDERLVRLMWLRAGQPLDLAALDSTQQHLRLALWEQGYADAVIDTAITVTRETRSAAVEIRIDPKWVARIGDIVVSGNERIGEQTILNSLTIDEGEIYRRSEVIRSQRSLYESGLFQHAAIVVPPQGDSTKLIEVTVREAPLQLVRLSGGFNTMDYGQLEASYRNYNWFGRARRLDVRGNLGNLLAPQLTGQWPFRDVTEDFEGDADPFLRPTWTVSAEVRQPWFQSPLNTVSLGVFGHRRSAPGVSIDRGYGVSATFTRELAVRITTSANYRFELTRVEAGDVYFCVNFGVCEDETIAALQGEHRLSPLSLSATADRSDDPLNPTRGWRARADAEHASGFTASEFRYNRASADASYYRPFGRSVLAGRLRLGLVRSLGSTASAVGIGGAEDGPILHPRKRFYAGGSQSVRGYGENQLGPRVLTIAPARLAAIGCDTSFAAVAMCDLSSRGTNEEGDEVVLADSDFQPRARGGNALVEGSIEFRFPIWRQLGGAVFVDGAIVGEGQDVFSLTGNTAAITPGFGIRFTTPVGPIRADVGINPCLAEELSVVTEAIAADGQREIIRLEDRRVYSPACGGTGFRSVLDRLQLHLSIGQAY